MDFGLESMPIAYAWGGVEDSDLMSSMEDLWNVSRTFDYSCEGILGNIKDTIVALFRKIVDFIKMVARKIVEFITRKKSVIEQAKTQYKVDDNRFDQPKTFKIMSTKVDAAITDDTFCLLSLVKYNRDNHGYKEFTLTHTTKFDDGTSEQEGGYHKYRYDDDSYDARFSTKFKLEHIDKDEVTIESIADAKRLIDNLNKRVVTRTEKWNYHMDRTLKWIKGDIRWKQEYASKYVKDDSAKLRAQKDVDEKKKELEICRNAINELSKIISWWSSEIMKSVSEIEQFACDYIKK